MYDLGLAFVIFFVGYGFGYSGGYKIAERKFREYMRDKYGHTSIFP